MHLQMRKDVADQIGVTKMTVSRCLRDPDRVSLALQAKIAAALDRLGYNSQSNAGYSLQRHQQRWP